MISVIMYGNTDADSNSSAAATTKQCQRWMLLLSIVLMSCSEPVVSLNSSMQERHTYISNALAQPDVPPVAKLFLELESEVPGFAGLYVDENGRLITRLVDPSLADLAIARVRVRLARRQPPLNLDTILVLPAEYSYSQLYEWNERGRADFLRQGQGSGVRVKTNRVVVAARDSASFDALLAASVRAGVNIDAVERSQLKAERTVATLRDYYTDSIPGGAGIWWARWSGVKNEPVVWSLCTANQHVRFGVGQWPMLMVSSHCSQTWGTADGTEIRQGDFNNYHHRIGNEGYDRAFNFSSTRCAGAPGGCKWSDAALMEWCCTYRGPHYRYIATTTGRGSATTERGALRLRVTSEYPDEDGELSEPTFPFEGEVIDRIGASTGWQYGTVVYNCIDRLLADNPGKAYLCQIAVADGMAEGGDSGGPAFFRLPGGNDVMYAGMVWAKIQPEPPDAPNGGFWYSPLWGIRKDYQGYPILLY